MDITNYLHKISKLFVQVKTLLGACFPVSNNFKKSSQIISLLHVLKLVFVWFSAFSVSWNFIVYLCWIGPDRMPWPVPPGTGTPPSPPLSDPCLQILRSVWSDMAPLWLMLQHKIIITIVHFKFFLMQFILTYDHLEFFFFFFKDILNFWNSLDNSVFAS